MNTVYLIGLPDALRKRLEAEARRHDTRIPATYCKLGPKGDFRLEPFSPHSVHGIQSYMDSLGDYAEADVIVLPYAPLPQELTNALAVVEEATDSFYAPNAGEDGWPAKPKPNAGEAFLNALYKRLVEELFPADDAGVSPREYFLSLAAANSRFIIAEGALDHCDAVAATRYEFLRQSADALLAFISAAMGSTGRIDAFLAERGLNHAQTGGITATVEVYLDGGLIHERACNTHIKQGDKTMRIAAARLYYDLFVVGDSAHVVILYAGPHPDSGCARVVHLPCRV